VNRRDWMKRFSLAAAAAAVPTAALAQAAGKPRLLTAICAFSFRDELAKGTMKYEDLIRLAADLGVDGLDLTVYWLPKNAADDYLLSLRRLAYRCGIDIYGIGIRAQMCRATPDLQDAEVARLKPWLDVAERLSARHVRVFGGSAPRDSSEEQAIGWAAETLKKCAAVAAPRGLLLGVEDDGAFTEKAERLVEIVKRADSPWVGICLDVGNFKSGAYRQIEECLPYAVNLHLKTEVNDGGKQQPLDWDRLFRIVAPAYHGYIALEYESSGTPPRTAVPEVIARLQATVRKYAPRG
jgi:sugar phosphate isomerase/epimerase